MYSLNELEERYYNILDEWINSFTIKNIKIYLFSEPLINLPLSQTKYEGNNITIEEIALYTKLLGFNKKELDDNESLFETQIFNIVNYFNESLNCKNYSYTDAIVFKRKFPKIYELLRNIHHNLISVFDLLFYNPNIINIASKKNFLDMYIDNMVKVTKDDHIDLYYNFNEFYSNKETYVNQIYNSFNFLFGNTDHAELVNKISMEFYLITPSGTILKVTDFDKINSNLSSINDISYKEVFKYPDLLKLLEDKGFDQNTFIDLAMNQITQSSFQEKVLNTIRNIIATRYLPAHIVEEINKDDSIIENELVDNILDNRKEDPSTEYELIIGLLDDYASDDNTIESIDCFGLNTDDKNRPVASTCTTEEDIEKFFNKLENINIKSDINLVSDELTENIENTRYFVYAINLKDGITIMRFYDKYKKEYIENNKNVKTYENIKEIKNIEFYLINSSK